MSNEAIENQAVPAQPDAATTPIDLASAFKALNQANREAAEASVASSEDATSTGSDNVGEGSNEPEASIGDSSTGSTDSIGESDGSGDDGGSTDFVNAIDFNAYKQGMLRDIQRNAQNQIRKEFNDQNIGYYSAAELTIRDEQSGKVRYRNPDVMDERDPDYYFKSRSDMMNFIQAWNQGVDFEFRKAVNEKQQELLQQEAPKARLIDFMPKWNAMDETTKKVFDALLEGHEIRDANGNEIGFDVNLDSVAAQATKITSSFGVNATQQQASNDAGTNNSKAASSSGPALDMQTGNGKSADEKEPTNIGEALKMFDKKNKGGK